METQSQYPAVVLVSGGMDSLTCLALAFERYSTNLLPLHLNYGQKTQEREFLAFKNICDFYKIPKNQRKVIDMTFLKEIGGSSLTDDAIEVSNFKSQKEIPTSYVPFRNTIILSLAVSLAEVKKCQEIYIGAVYEDSSGYPDCRPQYYEDFNKVIKSGTILQNLKVVTPLLRLSKKEIVAKALELKAPLELSWSCYQSSDLACGVCDSCALRLKGFQQLGVKDPIPYKVSPDYRSI